MSILLGVYWAVTALIAVGGTIAWTHASVRGSEASAGVYRRQYHFAARLSAVVALLSWTWPAVAVAAVIVALYACVSFTVRSVPA